MLVLTRKFGQYLVIGTDIAVQVYERKGNRVRLVLCAPQAVRFLREKLEDRQTAPQLDELDPEDEPFTDDFGALVLSRKNGQKIQVVLCGQLLGTITVLKIKDGSVKIGCQFDESIRIDRDEVFVDRHSEAPPTSFSNPVLIKLLSAVA